MSSENWQRYDIANSLRSPEVRSLLVQGYMAKPSLLYVLASLALYPTSTNRITDIPIGEKKPEFGVKPARVGWIAAVDAFW
jgi:hypothetical protein